MKGILFLMFFLSPLANASPISLEDSPISDEDKSRAREMRNNTQAPTSWVGGVAQSMANAAAEGSRNHASSCQSGNCDYVTVNFDVIAGFSTQGVDRKFSMHPVDSLTGRVDINASKNGVTIFKSYNQSLAGDYSWSASWDSNSKFCSGTVHVSGQKSNVNIKVYSDCRDAGSNEF